MGLRMEPEGKEQTTSNITRLSQKSTCEVETRNVHGTEGALRLGFIMVKPEHI